MFHVPENVILSWVLHTAQAQHDIPNISCNFVEGCAFLVLLDVEDAFQKACPLSRKKSGTLFPGHDSVILLEDNCSAVIGANSIDELRYLHMS
jgi:hypothetical protein